MGFSFEFRESDSPLVEYVWRTESVGGGSFMSSAESHWEMVVTRQQGRMTLTVRGPETQASPSPIPDDAEFFGIVFRLGAFMPSLPTVEFVDQELDLPQTSSRTFWLHGASWQFPSFDNADVFINRLARETLLVRDPVVEAALNGELSDLTLRSVQRRFLRATGVTHNTIYQIRRAQMAAGLLEQGLSILDAVEEAGYADQPHLTRALKRFLGRTPAEILRGGIVAPVQDSAPVGGFAFNH